MSAKLIGVDEFFGADPAAKLLVLAVNVGLKREERCQKRNRAVFA